MHISRASFSIAILVLTATYLFGGYSGRHDLFPFAVFQALKTRAVSTAPDRYTVDQAGRLASDDQKKAVACPQQTDRTAVLLLMGQSNAGNHAGQRFRSEHGGAVLNFFDGQCYVAASPLLGSDGTSGEYWTQLGNLLLDRGSFDQVLLAPAAIRARPLSRGQETLIGEPMSRDVIPTKHRHAPTHPFSSSSPAILLRYYAKRTLGLKAHESPSIAITA